MARLPRPGPAGRVALREQARATLAALTPPQRRAFLMALCEEQPRLVLRLLGASGTGRRSPE